MREREREREESVCVSEYVGSIHYYINEVLTGVLAQLKYAIMMKYQQHSM